MRNLATGDKKGYVFFISDSYQGFTHNKTIGDEIPFDFGELNVLVEKDPPNVIMLDKKPRKHKKTPLQMKINKAIGSVRVWIEHAFSGVKRLKIVRNKIRLKSYTIRDQMIKIPEGLHNLRVNYKIIQINSW
ncbi:MAG: hypothetical protein JJU23_00985 [Cyclobacteriaceae bacterium]|nr:hypothetical protein [Cyclobacteriaceae bacterium]